MYGINARSFFFFFFFVFASCSFPQTKDLCVAYFLKAGRGMWWCVRNRCFGELTCGKQEVGAGSEGSHLAYGVVWREMKHKCASCCVKETHSLTDKGSGDGGSDTHPTTSLVKHCIIVWNGINLEPPGPESELLFHQGKWLWSPRSLTLWSVHPVMNEVAVKGWKAGVHAYVCLWEYTLLNSVCATNNHF